MRSSTWPYLATRRDGLWLLRDAPRQPHGGAAGRGERKLEVIAHDVEPQRVVDTIHAAGLPWHFLCHLSAPQEDGAALRAAYKSQGYRAIATEWMFVHDLAVVPAASSDPPARRVRDAGEAERIRRARRGRRAIKAEDLRAEPAPQRLYAALDERGVYGWVSSIPVELGVEVGEGRGTYGWVADLFVVAAHRGRGFGRALMSVLLHDDRALLARASVLLASSDGARLYPHLGYRQIGVLQMFAPRERK